MESSTRAIDVGYGMLKYVSSVSGRNVLASAFPSIAPLAGRKDLAEALGRKRDTVEIEVDGLRYEVGPDAPLAQGNFVGRNTDNDFCLTPTYLALIRGALRYMNQGQIDLLVVGLPVSTFTAKREALKRRLIGQHPVGGGLIVDVKDVLVLSQPHGALGTFGLGQGMYATIKDQVNLVIDCGSRTFDWLLARGFQTIDQRSHAVNRGMIDIVETIAEQLEMDLGAPYRDFDKIDRALRSGMPPLVMGRRIPLDPYLPAARKIARDAVQELRRKVDGATDVDNLIVAGGGAFFFKPFLKEAFPRHVIQELAEGMMANVKGFQLYGMELEAAKRRGFGPTAVPRASVS